jgi:hypothetical protein
MVGEADVLLFLDVLAVLVLVIERRFFAQLDPGALLSVGGGARRGRASRRLGCRSGGWRRRL